MKANLFHSDLLQIIQIRKKKFIQPTLPSNVTNIKRIDCLEEWCLNKKVKYFNLKVL